MKRNSGPKSRSPPRSTDAGAAAASDWRDAMTARLRQLIQQADPAAVEERKWRKPSNPAGVPVWYHDGIVCHVVPLKGRVRLTFLKGASLRDPRRLFNACQEGNTMRAIDIRAGEDVDEEAVRALIRAAVAQNTCRQRDR